MAEGSVGNVNMCSARCSNYGSDKSVLSAGSMNSR